MTERVFVPPCGGVNECHPGRLDWTEPEELPREDSNVLDGDRANEPLPRLSPKPDCTRAVWLIAPDGREPKPALVRLFPVKKCCEADGAFRYEDALAARPVGL